jgi:serine carboxypeptidase-like clade 2
VEIDLWNQRNEGTAINLMSIIVGNGVMAFDTLQRSTYEYMIDRKFVDPEIVPIYQSSCQTDPGSAGCRYFEIEYNKGTEEVNPYNVYGYCYYNDSFDATRGRSEVRRQYLSQEAILMKLKKRFSPGPAPPRYNGAPCAFFDGIHDYFNLNEVEFKAKFPGQRWNGPCAENITYNINPSGSMGSYRYLLSLIPTSRKISIVLYNGNWDAVVPYVDTIKNIKRLDLVESYT